MQRKHRQTGRKPLGFAFPVKNERGRHDDQCRFSQAASRLLGEQVRQRLRCLAQPHVVCQHTAQRVFTQILQPAKAIKLIRAQRQRKALRRAGRVRAASTLQAARQLTGAMRAVQLPARQVAERCKPCGIGARHAQSLFPARAVEQIDQRARQWFYALGGDADTPALRALQLDLFIVGNIGNTRPVEPAPVAAKQAMQQWRQRQTLAIDDDAHIQPEPAGLTFGQLGIPGFNREDVMTKFAGNDDIPAGCPQFGRDVAGETDPRRFTFQPVGSWNKAPGHRNRMRLNRCETQRTQQSQLRFLSRQLTGNAHSFTTANRHIILRIVRRHQRFAVRELDLGIVVIAVVEGGCVFAMLVYRPATQRMQDDARLQRRVDLAQALHGINVRRGDVRRKFSQRAGHQRQVPGIKWRQMKYGIKQRQRHFCFNRPDFAGIRVDVVRRFGQDQDG